MIIKMITEPFLLCLVLIVFFSTDCVFMFYVVCYLYAPSYQEKFQVGVNLLGNEHFLILILIL